MRPDLTPAVCVVLVTVALVVAVPASGVVLSEQTATEAGETSGETLAGALAAHEHELEGDLDRRELAAALERADSDAATASVLAKHRLAVEHRVQRLADRRDSLRDARAAGEVSASTYRVEMRQLAARADALRSLLAAVENRSEELSTTHRRTYGLDDAALNRSRVRVAAVDPGDSVTDVSGDDPVGSTADLTEARNGTRRALRDVERRQAQLATVLERLADNDTDPAVLECARERLADSRAATERSRTALAADDTAGAEDSLVTGSTALRAAVGCLGGLGASESIDQFDINETTFDEPSYETPTADGTPTPSREFDEKWTPTPTDETTWDSKPTPTKGSFDYPTPTPTEDSSK